MIQKVFANKIIKHSQSLDQARRTLQALSAEILSGSKRAIFAFHRGDAAQAKQELASAREKLKEGWKLVKSESRIAQEGMWRAAQEEFAEADLFDQFLSQGMVGKVNGVAEDPDIFLGAVSDLTGELVRRAVLLATEGKEKEVEKIFQGVTEVVEFLLRMDLTGTLRTKVDQAKQNLRKLEEIRYDSGSTTHCGHCSCV
ncbi:hypothetical protein FJZ48_03000 [Candidatus Uhrbacteria bacterium]|nr:hypothetical protein [Candidatus Uhrbacteria bacterium]